MPSLTANMPSIFSSKTKLNSPGPVHKLFTHQDIFRFYRQPNINVSAPDCGPSGQIGNLNSIAGEATPAELFPTLTWHFDLEEKEDALMQKLAKIKEYLIVVEDLDGSKFGSIPPALGVYTVIPPQKTTITATDLVKDKEGKLERLRVAERGLVGGFKYADLGGGVWKTPKSMHRIHFQIIALSSTVDKGSLSEFPSIRSFYGECEGAVLGWGEWVGIYEKK
jgi:hypothetical protein